MNEGSGPATPHRIIGFDNVDNRKFFMLSLLFWLILRPKQWQCLCWSAIEGKIIKGLNDGIGLLTVVSLVKEAQKQVVSNKIGLDIRSSGLHIL